MVYVGENLEEECCWSLVCISNYVSNRWFSRAQRNRLTAFLAVENVTVLDIVLVREAN